MLEYELSLLKQTVKSAQKNNHYPSCHNYYLRFFPS